jgi:hypothetical protein
LDKFILSKVKQEVKILRKQDYFAENEEYPIKNLLFSSIQVIKLDKNRKLLLTILYFFNMFIDIFMYIILFIVDMSVIVNLKKEIKILKENSNRLNTNEKKMKYLDNIEIRTIVWTIVNLILILIFKSVSIIIPIKNIYYYFYKFKLIYNIPDYPLRSVYFFQDRIKDRFVNG